MPILKLLGLARLTLLLLPLAAAAPGKGKPDCTPHVNTISCTPEARGADACCVPSAGRFVFRQRFDPDAGDDGAWGIEALDVLECDGSTAVRGGRKRTHEEIGSQCARAKGFDVEENEGAWAQSEVGEGVEEVWERAWNTAGRFVTSLCEADDVPRFFDALLALHKRIKIGEALEHAGIAPSADTTYSLSDIEAALSPFGTPVPICSNHTLTHVQWPLRAIGNVAGWIADESPSKLSTNCPAEGILYPPAAVVQATPTTWDPIYRPTMRPITLSHDENKRVKYDDEEPAPEGVEGEKKKLGFFKGQDKRRASGDHGHDKYARDEL